MNQAEFKKLKKPAMLELLQSLFDDPEGELEAMSKAQLTQVGLNDWGAINPPEPKVEKETEVPVTANLDLGYGHSHTQPPSKNKDLG